MDKVPIVSSADACAAMVEKFEASGMSEGLLMDARCSFRKLVKHQRIFAAMLGN